MGTADTIWSMTLPDRDGESRMAKLYITGKDIEKDGTYDLELVRADDSVYWEMHSRDGCEFESARKQSEARKAVIDYIKMNPRCKPRDIAEGTGMTPNAVSSHLSRMNGIQVVKNERSEYSIRGSSMMVGIDVDE